MNQRRLIEAIRSSNEEAIIESFNSIYDEYHKLIYFVISKYVINHEDIEDIKNDVFLSFFNNLNNLEITKSLKYYLTTSAKNKSINFLKNRNKNIELSNEFIYNLPDKNENIFNYELLIEEMRTFLREEEIEIIISKTVYDEKFKDIAKRINKPLNSTITLYHRAIKKFKKNNKI